MREPCLTAAAAGLSGCHTCGRVAPSGHGKCPRCGSPVHERKRASLERTVALIIASVALYLPANLLPIMTVEGVGGAHKSTIVGGVLAFWESGSYPVAIIIFSASVIIPIAKIAALIVLCLAVRRPTCNPRRLTRVYRLTEIVGRWSMVDVFVVAILVTLVQLGRLMTIEPGPAALAFAGVVILTMLAAMSFDPRLIWDRQHATAQPPRQP